MANSSFYSGTGTNPTDVDSITSSKTAAETAATNAATSEANAATSATNAAASATDASNSASSISGSVAAAASSATDSANSATSSSTSAAEAATSASNASTSATSASTSASSATSSASSAADSALDASGSATAAASSAASASTSASNAATSEANAATSASQAAASATTAQAAASNTDVATVSSNVSYVQTVADNISDVETVSNNVLKINTVADNVSGILAANSSSTQAVSSASDAASSATQAAASATSAATSASTATAAKDAALEALDNFDDRYLGQKASDPTVDNDGDALVAGALYFDTTTDTMKVYEGSIWVAAYASLSGALIAANNLSDVTNVTTARTSLGLGTAATTASTDYATAAQGNLADTSVQPNDNPTFGSITVTGTVDGRDVAADGTTLDAVSTTYLPFSGGTMTGNLSFGDNDKAIFGASSDLQIYHDGSNSYVQETGAGQLLLRGAAQVKIESSATDDIMVRANSGGSVDLFHAGSAKLTTTSTGVDITGTLTSDGLELGEDAITYNLGTSGSGTIGRADRVYIQFNRADFDGSMNFYTTTNGSAGISERLRIADNGDISFYEDTGTTAKFFWDASAESLGIGTSSPSKSLHILNTSATGSTNPSHLRIEGNNSNYYDIGRDNSGTGFLSFYGSQTGATGYIFGGVDGERLRIDSSGRVGIGTSSPTYKFHAKSTSGAVGILESTTGASTLYLKNSGTTYDYSVGVSSSNNDLRFLTGDGSEAARFDSSGNLLVGTTTNDAWYTSSNEGHNLNSGNFLAVARNGGTSFVANRLGTDGDAYEVRKNGTIVGTIGTFDAGYLYIASTRTTDAGIKIGTSRVAPSTTTGADRDNAIDLGYSSGRWKDLYLSGGVYLGGTGSANKLDDYEEGTFNSSIYASSSGSVIMQAGADTLAYTKIGRQVTVTGDLRISSVSSPVGNSFMNLPFAVGNFTDLAERGGTVMLVWNGSSWQQVPATTSDNNSYINISITPAAGYEYRFFYTYFTN